MQRAKRKKKPKMKDIFVRKDNILTFIELAACLPALKRRGSTAKIENGVLTITLPKMKLEEPAKKIQIE
jgi:HSP20 family protein